MCERRPNAYGTVAEHTARLTQRVLVTGTKSSGKTKPPVTFPFFWFLNGNPGILIMADNNPYKTGSYKLLYTVFFIHCSHVVIVLGSTHPRDHILPFPFLAEQKNTSLISSGGRVHAGVCRCCASLVSPSINRWKSHQLSSYKLHVISIAWEFLEWHAIIIAILE